MTVTVEPMTFELAEVTLTPSFWRRVFLRDREEVRFAVRTKYGAWIWDDTQAPIFDLQIEHALDHARREALRMVRDGDDEPPS